MNATQAAWIVVDALARAGVRDVVIAPGSRSAPLVGAVSAHPLLRSLVVHDERSGAFVALGIARATGRAAVLLTTSGTAVGNAMPALLEAEADRIPFVMLSADRPPEAIGTDANQSIDQRHLFGAHVRSFVDVDPPDELLDDAPAWVHASIEDALACAHGADGGPRGPVHINARYRKPLEPDEAWLQAQAARAMTSADAPSSFDKRARRARHDDRATSSDELQQLWLALHTARRPLLLCGAAADDDDRAGLRLLADACTRAGVEVAACALSGLRDARHGRVDRTDAPAGHRARHAALLAKAGCVHADDFDVVVVAGGACVTPELAALAARAHRGQRLWRIDDRARRRLELGPARLIARAPGDVAAFVVEQAARPAPSTTLAHLDAHADALLRGADADADASAAGDARAGSDDMLHEDRVVRAVAHDVARRGHALFVGNSMPVRDLDLLCGDVDLPRVFANRGASGIDGIVSTAAGVARATGPTTLLVGDVSFLHDAGSMSALARAALPLRIVVIDNRGGGIFDFLPIAQHGALMPAFTTPHDVDLAALARAYGVPTVDVPTTTGLRAALAHDDNGADGLFVIVARVPPAGAASSVHARRHRALRALLQKRCGVSA